MRGNVPEIDDATDVAVDREGAASSVTTRRRPAGDPTTTSLRGARKPYSSTNDAEDNSGLAARTPSFHGMAGAGVGGSQSLERLDAGDASAAPVDAHRGDDLVLELDGAVSVGLAPPTLM